jgi:hypothetical protein
MAALDTPKRLRLIEFMGLLAGLLGVIVALGPPYIAFPAGNPWGAVFVIYLAVFIVESMASYTAELVGKRRQFPTLRNLVYLFTLLVSLLSAAAALRAALAYWALSPQSQGLLFVGAWFVFEFLVLTLLPPLRRLEDLAA